MVCAYFIYFHVDFWFSKPLLEKVEVKERRFVSEQPRYANRYGPSYQPATWTLKVANEHGQGWVSVSPTLYDAVQIGDSMFVKGERKWLSGRWNLEVASKKPLKP